MGAVWPSYSPGAANAWLLLVTSKAPSWSHSLLQWQDDPPTLGQPHHGFFYPDPLGFWDEVRRWVAHLVPSERCGWALPDALSVSALVHTSDWRGSGVGTLVGLIRPRRIVFLDGASWEQSALVLAGLPEHHHIRDPHRPDQVYEGFWGRLVDSTVVGKAPQHPTTHRLYRAADMDAYLRAAPSRRPSSSVPPVFGAGAH